MLIQDYPSKTEYILDVDHHQILEAVELHQTPIITKSEWIQRVLEIHGALGTSIKDINVWIVNGQDAVTLPQDLRDSQIASEVSKTKFEKTISWTRQPDSKFYSEQLSKTAHRLTEFPGFDALNEDQFVSFLHRAVSHYPLEERRTKAAELLIEWQIARFVFTDPLSLRQFKAKSSFV